MKFAHLLAAAVFTTSSLGSVPGFAAGLDCSCITTGATSGQIVSAKGNVLTNGKKDFVLATAGTPIAPGSEISVGAKSAASISIGTCALPLMANSVTRVSAQKDGNICVASVQTASATYGAPLAGPNGAPATPAGARATDASTAGTSTGTAGAGTIGAGAAGTSAGLGLGAAGIAAGVAAAVGVAIAASSNGGDNGTPVSP